MRLRLLLKGQRGGGWEVEAKGELEEKGAADGGSEHSGCGLSERGRSRGWRLGSQSRGGASSGGSGVEGDLLEVRVAAGRSEQRRLTGRGEGGATGLRPKLGAQRGNRGRARLGIALEGAAIGRERMTWMQLGGGCDWLWSSRARGGEAGGQNLGRSQG